MCKTIKQRVKFKADPATVYDLLADSRKHTALTGRRAIISRKIGGTFTIGESDVTGINVDLVPGLGILFERSHIEPVRSGDRSDKFDRLGSVVSGSHPLRGCGEGREQQCPLLRKR